MPACRLVKFAIQPEVGVVRHAIDRHIMNINYAGMPTILSLPS